MTGPGIDCPGDCAEELFDGSRAVLTPDPAAGSRFAGWGGDCEGTGPCEVLLDADRTVSASFQPKQRTDLSLVARKRRVERGERARLKVLASPCPGRVGDEIALRRGKRVVARATAKGERCRARFRPRIRRSATFEATIAEDERHLAATSKRLRIKARRR